MKNIFIHNIKSNHFFNDMLLLEKGENFTGIDTEFIYNETSEEYIVNDKPREYKVLVSTNELEVQNNYRALKNYDNTSKNPGYYGIIFKSLTKYNIRFPYISNKELIENLKISDSDIEVSYNGWQDCLLVIQNIVEKSLVKMLTNIQDYSVSTKIMDKKAYSYNFKENLLSSFVPFFMVFYFVPCICSLLNHLVIEKESRIKESLVIIGLKKSSFWVSWAITYGAIIALSSILVTVAMYYFKFFVSVHWTVTIVVMLIFGLSCCCISFIFSTLIKKGKTANTVGVMIIIGFFVMYFLQYYINKYKTSKFIFSFLLSPIAFLNIFGDLIKYEKQFLSVTFITIFGNKSLRKSFFALIFTFILYFIIAIYLDNVLPQGNNFHKKWHFFITDLFRKKHKKTEDGVNRNVDNPYIQEDPEGLNKAVEVKNVGMNFKVEGETIEILKSINFNAYYDEIFAILGHNGAGKTTLMNIMTGILSATRGEVYYDDIPITGNETDICKQFGYCPQFDTFNNNLTVGEHVKLFAGIKNVKVNVKEVLKDIDLLEKKDNFPKQLSGGQKRKLCITLALLGSPKYVFLDEPTTGLDPYSRKNIWEILSKKKKGCVTFVTTHYMDEADLLADRKMIISNGNITCLGTSLFLKNSFNMNYSLDVHVKKMEDVNYIDNIIDRYCPDASQAKTISNTNIRVGEGFDSSISEEYLITYLLPMKYSKSFKGIFEELNSLIKDHSNTVENYSLTAPTLEELFVKLENNDIKSSSNKSLNDASSINMLNESGGLIDKLEPVFNKTRMNNSSFVRQVLAIVKLRLKIFIRNKSFALLYTLLPIALVIACIYIENKIIKTVNEPIEYDALDIGPKLYEDVDWFKDTSSSGEALEIINNIEKNSKLVLKPVDYENELTIASGKLTPDLQYAGGFRGTGDIQNLEFIIYKNATYYYSNSVGLNALSNAILRYNNKKEQIVASFKPFDEMIRGEYNEEDSSQMINMFSEMMKIVLEPILIVGMALAISVSISIYGPLTVKEREDGITHQLFLNGTKRMSYWIGVLISDSICILVPTFLIGIVGLYKEIGVFDLKIIPYTIVVTILWAVGSLLHQYVVSYFFKKYERISSLFIIINPVLCLFIGIYAMIVGLLTSISVENPTGGVKMSDITKKYITIFYVVLIFYVPAAIVLFYTKISTFIITRKLKIDKNDITRFLLSSDALKIMGDKSLSNAEKGQKITKMFFDGRMPSLSDLFKSKDNFVFLLLMAIGIVLIYAVILFILENRKNKYLRKNKNYTPDEREELDKKLVEGPKDVYNEWKRVQQSLDENNSNINNNIALKVYELNKNFKISFSDLKKRNDANKDNSNTSNEGISNEDISNEERKKEKKNKKDKKTAFQKMDDRITYDKKSKKYINRTVDDVTFGVNVGECLGLLGPNGAGKTTSISMITGLLSHTHGKVVYGNSDLNETDMADLSLGYCSQHDSLWKLLTVKETIQFYLNICGYPRKDIPHFTKALTEACGIENHRNKKVGDISGGTKRKLSLIIAICSSPSYLILDEPSAGMDPFTRRYMWKLISELKKARETATLLTTHSTEEAEALCERIAILIKGRLVCVDTPKSIKMNHSNRYTLEVFTDQPEQFEEEVVKNGNLFGPDVSYELETSISYQKYTVIMDIENISNVFAMMEEAKDKGIVSQYNFGQYSLEQVFINFVNNVE